MVNSFDKMVTDEIRKIFTGRSRGNIARLRSRNNIHIRPSLNDTLIIVVNQGCKAGCGCCFRYNKDVITMEENLLERITEYASRHLFSISLTGGEPTECIDLIGRIAGRFPDLRIYITSNGENYDEEVINILRNNPNLFPAISLNGIADIHDISRHPGSFNRVMNTIEKLRAERIPFGIMSMVNHSNIKQVVSGELAEFFENTGACTVEFFHYYPIGDDDRRHIKLMLNSEEIDESLRYRNKLLKSNPYRFLYRSAQVNTKRCERVMEIWTDGTVSYCPYSPWGFEKIGIDDTDEHIRAKLEMFKSDWDNMTASAPSFCPLQSDIKNFINFFTEKGREKTKPTGIFDINSDVNKKYIKIAKDAAELNP